MGISQLLHPEDRDKFREASEKLQRDDSHTVEIQFRIQVEEEDDPERPIGPIPEPAYRLMEGSGMLMLDRVEHIASHTMWVIKPAPEPIPQAEAEDSIVEGPSLPGQTPTTPFRFPGGRLSIDSGAMPVIKTLSATPILCRICENQIPSWFFEKHNETCNDVHKFEADIIECNESIAELRNTVRELISGFDKLGINIEKSIPERPVLEYRGMSISSPSSTTATNSPIQSIRGPLASRMQRVGVRKLQQKLLEQVEEILTTAGKISVPSLKEEEASEPIERQRLLSPTSEDYLGKCTAWVKPTPEDPALSRLVQDVDYLIKQKLDTVMRMQNTVRYSEKIRQEWTVKYEEALAAVIADASAIDTLPEEGQEEAAQDGASDDTSSTTSEYDFGRDKTPAEPTPMASSPAPTPLSTLPMVPVMPVPVPATWQGVGAHRHSRSSTPSSVTSPLATAAPINATTPEAIDRAGLLAAVEDSAQTIRARRISMHNGNGGTSIPPLLEPKLLVTPPISPLIATTVGPISTTGHARRLSMVQPILSPTVAVGPSHGRAASVAPSAAKAAPSSIKDFDIIKPISKGAFGSVFLAKKKTTGDYFAIKVLKKADMIAKNQITNVKAERMILMKQAESPFVVKLYFTFQSKDNLYLVMEYLNGGDCAALIKTLGSLPEEWTRAYVAEVVLGLEFLHERGIVHRSVDSRHSLYLSNHNLTAI
jgi:serine/threonine-protein kinase RIM15